MDTVIVSNSQFYSHYPKRIPRGTVKAEAVLIRLGSEWDGLTVRIHWLNVESGVEKVVLLERDQPNTIPWEVLTDLGELRMGLVGLDGETVIKPTIWLTYGYVVDGVDPESGSDPQPPTPSWEQQMVEQATAAANAAKVAKETADRLQTAAESGEFNGDPGPAGPPGKSPIIRNGTWWIWNNDTKDYTDTGVIASGGGGGGVSSYNDLSDRPTIGGVLLAGNKTAQELNLQPAGEYLTDSDVPDWAKQPEKPKYTPEEVGAQPAGNYLQDGDVPSWAMQPQKPTYTAQEVGAQPTGDYAQKSDIPEKLPNPQALTIKGQTYDGSQPVKVDVVDGKTPVKGIDYFTEADVQEVAEKAAALAIGLKLLAEETMEEEAIPILDIGDVASNYSLIRVYITVPKVESTFQSYIAASVPKSTTGLAYNMAQVKFGNTSGESFVFLEFWPLIYRGICKRGLAYGPLNTISITSEMQYAYNSHDYNRLKSARYVRTSAALPAGSTISIYGVKR